MTVREDTPFHEGERSIQDLAGTRARMDVAGPRLIRDQMPDQHRELFEKLPWLIAGIADASGQPWATALAGTPGFVTTTPRDMRINALPDVSDPARTALQPGAAIGLLGIELETRRRNRMNGRVREVGPTGFAIDVVQSFGNCPKYIQTRQHRWASRDRPVYRQTETAVLSPAALALIESSDTFFIATTSGLDHQDRNRGVDVSHRGGDAGFAMVEAVGNGTRLLVPDFAGNGFFNTLGNLALDPRAGLLFVDFANGHLLQLAARGHVAWHDAETAAATRADRMLVLDIFGGQWLHNAIDLRWV
jgi:uncharacterized protein